MNKLYTIKFYSQQNGSTKLIEHDQIKTYEYDKIKAFESGRVVLSKFAKNFINSYDGDRDDSRLVDAIENYHNLNNNSINGYYEDQTNWTFKVFSKKIKNNY